MELMRYRIVSIGTRVFVMLVDSTRMVLGTFMTSEGSISVGVSVYEETTFNMPRGIIREVPVHEVAALKAESKFRDAMLQIAAKVVAQRGPM